MTQPQLARATEAGRMYARSTGGEPEVPSITTVIGQAASDLTGWAGHMAATAAVGDERLAAAVGSPAQLRRIARDASDAAARFRDQAAARGDRVHGYAEQVALRALGREHDVAGSREVLAAAGEVAYADRFDEWWDGYGVEPLDPKVVMQLAAGAQAQERVVDPERGEWEAWPYPDDVLLLGVALGETEVLTQRADTAVLPTYWHRFWALRQVWESTHRLPGLGPALRPIAPPPPTQAP